MAALTPDELRDIQGIILTGYGHLNYGCYQFFKITDRAACRAWLRALIPDIRTAAPWPKAADGSTLKPDDAVHVAFTYAGMAQLGLSEESLLSFSRQFISGMPSRADILGDVGEDAPEHW